MRLAVWESDHQADLLGGGVRGEGGRYEYGRQGKRQEQNNDETTRHEIPPEMIYLITSGK